MNDSQPAYPVGAVNPTPAPASPRKRYQVGMILIVFLSCFGILGSCAQLLNPVVLTGPIVLTGVTAVAINLILLAAYVCLLIWLIQKKERGRILGIIISGYQILIATVIFVSGLMYRDELTAIYGQFIPGVANQFAVKLFLTILGVSAVLNWMVGTAVILYLVFKKQYFSS